jgi:hypothetical protein
MLNLMGDYNWRTERPQPCQPDGAARAYGKILLIWVSVLPTPSRIIPDDELVRWQAGALKAEPLVITVWESVVSPGRNLGSFAH